MDYEKKHKEALERARKVLLDCTQEEQNVVEYIYPELKESDDERIRKELIRFHKSTIDIDGIKGADVIAWLEKQETSYTKKDVDDAYLKGVTDRKNETEKQYEANYQIRKDIATFIFNYKDDIKDRAKWIDYLGIKVSFAEKQGEQKHIVIIPKFNIGDEIKTANEEPLTITKIDEKGYWSEDLFICSFENSVKWELVGKLIAKLEPKFKVGDWIKHNKANFIFQINKVTDNKYEFNNPDGYNHSIPIKSIDKQYHLWTIADAKDGDVLVHNGCTFIFMGIKNGVVQALEENLFDGVNPVSFGEPDKDNDYYPATKEQRDTLMKAMADAGYTFDFEKKELKKIENEIEIPFGAKDSELQEVTYYIPKGFHAEIDDDKVVIKKGKKPAWSEEDEKTLERIIMCIENHNYMNADDIHWLKSLKNKVQHQPKQEWSEEDKDFMYDTLSNLTELKDRYGEGYGNVGKCIDWFKSLKDRYTWKPSEEQMEAFEHFIRSIGESGFASHYDSNTKLVYSLLSELKKLK